MRTSRSECSGASGVESVAAGAIQQNQARQGSDADRGSGRCKCRLAGTGEKRVSTTSWTSTTAKEEEEQQLRKSEQAGRQGGLANGTLRRARAQQSGGGEASETALAQAPLTHTGHARRPCWLVAMPGSSRDCSDAQGQCARRRRRGAREGVGQGRGVSKERGREREVLRASV